MLELNLTPIIKEETAEEKVYTQLKDSILNGTIQKDQVFTEVQLAESFDISRTPIRSAVKSLLNEGLLVTLPRKGLKVREITRDEQEQIFLLRISIETEVIKKTATMIDEEILKKIEHIYAQQEQATKENNNLKFIQLDQEFHSFLIEISNYELIKQTLLNLHNLSTLIGLKAIGQQGRMRQTLQEHYNIINALRERNPESAATYMKKHLYETNETLKKLDQP